MLRCGGFGGVPLWSVEWTAVCGWPGGTGPDLRLPLRGGEHYFPADQDVADRIVTLVPEIRDCAWANGRTCAPGTSQHACARHGTTRCTFASSSLACCPPPGVRCATRVSRGRADGSAGPRIALLIALRAGRAQGTG